jgi:uncharacterized protein YndB with AHSA1/START domain
MATVRRTRHVAAPIETVWKVVESPYDLPRWWPGVARVEGVTADRWTQVFITSKGKPVRADFHLLGSSAPHSRHWEQEVAGTPFERVLVQSIVEVALELDGDGTRVTIEQRQQMRGYSPSGRWQIKRASSKKLDEALDGLERLF